MVASLEPAFVHLHTQAEALAARRTEPLRGVHLLAALGATPSPVRDVLEAHGAGFRRVLNEWDQVLDTGEPENQSVFRRRVSAVARAFGTRTPTASHVLIALLDDTHGSARRVLSALGVSEQALRGVVTAIGQGLPRATRDELPVHRAPARGQIVPVMPAKPVLSARHSAVNQAPIASAAGLPNRARESGQALSVIPKVGPTPLPGNRLRVSTGSDELELPSAQLDPAVLPNGQSRAPLESLSSGSAGQTGTAGATSVSEETLRERYELCRKKFPILTQVGKNLTLAAALGQSDPVVGRQEEIEQALDVLAKRQGNNPCIIGEAGVGKTSVARGIAQAIVDSPDDDRLVIEIPISELVAGTGVRGALAGRLAALKKEVKAAQERVILFFDEVHQLFSGDAAEEIASDLKLSLSRGELPCIGATTMAEYRRVVESDAAISRRFTAIEVEEPGRDDAFLVLSSLAQRLEKHHKVVYDEEAISLSITWSVRYLTGRCLPDKAVSVLDLAGARTRRRGASTVTSEAVAQIIASQANMPMERLLESDGDRMLRLNEMLAERVIGHQHHLDRVARILRRNAAGLGGRRPIGTFLLLGPTGVGKTETAKAIAEVLFHSESAMTRIDMAEMSESHAVAKLVGAPPGYVGHDAGGQLTEAVRRRPYQVVLLDEIEKAHPEVLTAFLAVFDEGRMTDSRGRLVDFTNTVLILTSNLGSGEFSIASKKRVGFSTGGPETDDLDARVVAAARKALPPELYNRIDEVLPFSPLSRADVMKIGRKLCQGLADEVELGRGIELRIADSAISVLLDLGGYEPELGARPLRRMLARKIEGPLAEAILGGALGSGDTWHIDGDAGELRFETIRARQGAAE